MEMKSVHKTDPRTIMKVADEILCIAVIKVIVFLEQPQNDYDVKKKKNKRCLSLRYIAKFDI